MHYQFELAIRQYIAAFNGTNDISPEEFKARFNNLYYKNYTFVPKEEKIIGKDGMMHLKAKAPLTRDQIFKLESSKLASGTKMTLIHFRKIGLDCFDIKIRQETGEQENTIRVVTTITAVKHAVISKEIDESFPLKIPQAKFENAAFKWYELQYL
jgi:hypothetical protein